MEALINLCLLFVVAGIADVDDMVDLGGYVIILVETRDHKIKLYGPYCTFQTADPSLFFLSSQLIVPKNQTNN